MNTAGKPKTLIVGGFSFSRGEAGSNYVIGLGKAIEGAGFRVEYLADNGDGATVREEFRAFTCHFAPPVPLLRGWRANLRNLSASGDNRLECLDKLPRCEFHTVIAYGGGLSTALLWRLRRLCLAKTWKLAVVVGEWQGFWQFGLLKLRHRLLATVDSEIQRRVLYKKIKHIIAISRFLQRYYNTSGCQAILVPPLIDTHANKWHCRPATEADKRGLKLLFSGGWWRDRLDLIVEAVLRLRGEGLDVVLEFLGSGPDDIGRNLLLRKTMMRAPDGTLRFHGKVPVEKVLPITASADFGVLLRDRAKWSDACFPSKVVEFQALGVPLLCNLTSNLEEVLSDGDNALIVAEVSVAAFVAAVKRALALSPAAKHHMRQCSLRCAANSFDYRTYSDSVGQYIGSPSALWLM